jgi:hypothetical protein
VASQAIGETTLGNDTTDDDRRQSPRFSCDGFAEVFVPETGCLFRGQIRDISHAGCFIMTMLPLRLQRLDEVEVLFRLKGKEMRSFARVMNIRPGKGVGLKFFIPNVAAKEIIEKSLKTLVDTVAKGTS